MGTDFFIALALIAFGAVVIYGLLMLRSRVEERIEEQHAEGVMRAPRDCNEMCTLDSKEGSVRCFATCEGGWA